MALSKDNSYCLLVGVGKREADSEAMKVSADDAMYLGKAIKKFLLLKDDKITLVRNEEARKQNVLQRLDELAEITAANPADFVLIFFSGHGARFEGKYYLICRDSNRDYIDDTAIRGDLFLDKLNAIQTDKMLVLLDCCHSKGMSDREIPFDETGFLKSRNRVILTACPASQLSYLSKPASIFTYAVIEALSGKFLNEDEKKVTLFSLAMDVRERVVTLSAKSLGIDPPQKPQLNVLPESSTTNFELAAYPTGRGQAITFFKDEQLTALTSDDGKNINLEVANEPDEDFRRTYNWLYQNNTIRDIGDGNYIVQGVQGDVQINNGISAEQLSTILKSVSSQIKADFVSMLNEKEDPDAKQLVERVITISDKQKTELDNYEQSKKQETIRMRFKLDSLQKIGFEPGDLQQEFFEGLQNLHSDGIELNANYYDDLSRTTISNGHNILKSDGIFSLKSQAVEHMAELIGKYLFRLLFNNQNLCARLQQAKRSGKKVEIQLDFDPANPESVMLASLPWELMYCPRMNLAGAELDGEDGFFLAKDTYLYRYYTCTAAPLREENNKLCVAVAFLVKDTRNLQEVYQEFRKSADQISQNQPGIEFEFINEINKNTNEVYLLTKNDLDKIFLGYKNNSASQKVNKIIHIVGDVGFSRYNNENTDALYFKKRGTETESIAYREIFRELFNRTLFPDPYLKLVVLQGWNGEEDLMYPGFESFATEILKKSQTSIVTMPYVQKQEDNDRGKTEFFNVLYSGIASSMSLRWIVQNLRRNLMPNYSYGFPVFYYNNTDDVLLGNVSAAPPERAFVPGAEIRRSASDPGENGKRDELPSDGVNKERSLNL
jgi:hypothetical protein